MLIFAHVHTSTSRKEVLGNGVDEGASLCLGAVEIPALVFLGQWAQLADWCEKEAMLWFCLKSPSRIAFLIASSYKVQYSGPVGGGGGTQWEVAFPLILNFCPPLLLYPIPNSLNLLFSVLSPHPHSQRIV